MSIYCLIEVGLGSNPRRRTYNTWLGGEGRDSFQLVTNDSQGNSKRAG